ncbi:MAG: hypothetical protein LBH44_05835 [Treponema sp.]|jgi:hypothetical protein|nr:hypothetical protein [Treponema sp.]
MGEHAVLLREIQTLPANCVGEVVDFVAWIKHRRTDLPRQGWDDAFSTAAATMSEAGADKLLLPEHIDSTTFEWVW